LLDAVFIINPDRIKTEMCNTKFDPLKKEPIESGLPFAFQSDWLQIARLSFSLNMVAGLSVLNAILLNQRFTSAPLPGVINYPALS